MNRAKRLLISMIALLCCCTGTWASSIPGALSGRFTINASGEKVLFSQGNLQYQASTDTWRFAENQYDYIGSANSSISESYTGWIDLFGWATNGLEANTATGKMPYYTGTTNEDYGPSITSGEFDKTIYDWGKAIDDSWHTLSNAEWNYIFAGRPSYSSLYGFGCLFGVNGVFLLPDDWSWSETSIATAATAAGFAWSGGAKIFSSNIISNNTLWSVMESAGAVFIPAAGYRQGTTINMSGNGGDYWSSTASSDKKAYRTSFYDEHLNLSNNYGRSDGISVRLVRSSLEKDGEGNYLLSSAQDWKDFAAIVNSGTNPAANAKMTADIDLGDDQTHIGDNNNLSYAYCGVFDGQGHKLNVNYYSSSSSTDVEGGYSIAPFRNINGATIKNLAVTGNITGYMHCAGVVGYAASPSTNLINNVTVSANITILNTHGGGFIGHNENATTTIQDCLFNGTINGKNGGSTVGVFFGWSGNATMSLINCLENGSYTNCSTFTPTSCPGYAVPTVTNCYYTVSGSYPGTHATSAQLADGTIAYKLQNNRGDLVWGQRIGTDAEPVLTNDENYRVYRGKNDYTNSPEEAYEGIQQDGEGNYLLGCLSDWQDFAEIVNSGTNAAANAKMTADIDLGDDQTHIGSMTEGTEPFYAGVFDGQGHTLTVNFVGGSNQIVAPFTLISSATIKNLHVAGSIQSSYAYIGVVGMAGIGSVISKVWMSATMNTTQDGWVQSAAIAGYCDGSIQDCLFTGTYTSNGGGYMGGFYGYTNASPTITNCLSTGTFSQGNWQGNGVHTNCYLKQYPAALTTGCSWATNETLSDGTIATALQNERAEEVWVQDPVTNQPMLAIFANGVTLTDGDNLSALETFAGKTCTVAYSRSFTAGMSSTVCLPFAFAKGSVGTFYTFTGISKSGSEYIADMTEYTGDNLEANTPYLFLPSATGNVDFGGTYAIPASLTAGSTVSGDWTFLGTYETVSWTEAPTGIYGFSAQNVDAQGISQGEFVKVGAYVRIKPMRCYLKYDDGNSDYAGARSMTRGAEAEQLPETIKVRLIGANGEATSIGSLQTKTGEVTFDSDAWYTLEGVQLNGKPTRKGIYVNNGKKVIIK